MECYALRSGNYNVAYGIVCVPLARLVDRFTTSCAAQNDRQDPTLCIVAKITFAVSDFVRKSDHSDSAISRAYRGSNGLNFDITTDYH